MKKIQNGKENFADGNRFFGFSAKSRRDKENFFGWSLLLCWGSTTRLGFRKNHAGTRKTFLGVARFRVGERKPLRVQRTQPLYFFPRI
ncbi:MAG: hypothetical protein K2N31_08270, partial [Treponemataceae bacterium]|nr:hypothetical protein [Treponemataceae bacterium]